MSGVVRLHGIFLAAFKFVRSPRWIAAVAVVADSYGAAQEAGGPAEVAGARVGDVVIATDLLIGRHGYRARSGSAHDAVCTVGLVGHTGVGSRTHYIGA